MDTYSSHCRLHLIKIRDLSSDTRTIIEEIMHDKSSPNHNVLNKFNTGRIPLDYQYNSPYEDYKAFENGSETETENNKKSKSTFQTTVCTALNISLKDSTRFKEKCSIVRLWSRTLSTGSIWQFNLTHHLGKGVSINYINDIKNKNHPYGYIFCLECVGDRRAAIKKIESESRFDGYSPIDLRLEHDFYISYLLNENGKNGNDEIITYKVGKSVPDFDDDNEMKDVFHPNREERINVNYQDIKLSTNNKKDAKYKLEYDRSLVRPDMTSSLKDIIHSFKEAGQEFDNLTEDDKDFAKNVQKSPEPEDE